MKSLEEKIEKIYDALPLGDDELLSLRTQRNTLKNRVIGYVLDVEKKNNITEDITVKAIKKLITSYKRKKEKTEETFVTIFHLQAIQVLLSRMEALRNMFDERKVKTQDLPSVPEYEFNTIVQLQKASKKTNIFSYEMLFLGVNEKVEQQILSEFIGYTWDTGFAVLSYEFKQFDDKNKRCLSIQFKSKKYFKLPEEDLSINHEKSWEENLGSDYLRKNIYSRLSNKEQFYGSIWGYFDDKELPEAFFMTEKNKYNVIWCKRAYLELV